VPLELEDVDYDPFKSPLTLEPVSHDPFNPWMTGMNGTPLVNDFVKRSAEAPASTYPADVVKNLNAGLGQKGDVLTDDAGAQAEQLRRASEINTWLPGMNEDWRQFTRNPEHSFAAKKAVDLAGSTMNFLSGLQNVPSALKNELETFIGPIYGKGKVGSPDWQKANFDIASSLVGGPEGSVGAGWSPKAFKFLKDDMGVSTTAIHANTPTVIEQMLKNRQVAKDGNWANALRIHNEDSAASSWSPEAQEFLNKKQLVHALQSPAEIEHAMKNDPGFGGYPYDADWQKALEIHKGGVQDEEQKMGLETPTTTASGSGWSPKATAFLKSKNVDPYMANPAHISGEGTPLTDIGKAFKEAKKMHEAETGAETTFEPIGTTDWTAGAKKYLEGQLGLKPPLETPTASAISQMLEKGPEWTKTFAGNEKPGTPGFGSAQMVLAKHEMETQAAAKAAEAEAQAKAAAEAKAAQKAPKSVAPSASEALGFSVTPSSSAGPAKAPALDFTPNAGWSPEAIKYLQDNHWTGNAKSALKGDPQSLADMIKNGTWGDAGGHYTKALELSGVKPEVGAAPAHTTVQGPVTHPQVDEAGKKVLIKDPSVNTAQNWGKPGEITTFTPAGAKPTGFGAWDAPKDAAGWEKERGTPIKEPAFVPAKGLPSGAGVVVMEPGGKGAWIVSPTNKFGDEYALPKGRVDKGMDQQSTALKEAYEETGLRIKLRAHLGDVTSPYSRTRYYLGERAGGDPSHMGWESQAVHHVPIDKVKGMLNSKEQEIFDKAVEAAKTNMKPVGTAGQTASEALFGGGGTQKGVSAAEWKKFWETYYPPLKVPKKQGAVPPFNPNQLPMDMASVQKRMTEAGFGPHAGQWDWWRGVSKDTPFSWEKMGYHDPVQAGAHEPAIFLHEESAPSGHYGSLVNPHLVKSENPKTLDWKGAGYSGSKMTKAIKDAWAAGHDTLLIKNVSDLGGKHHQLMVRHPSQLRHPYAVFDPAFKKSGNLLSARGVPLGGVNALGGGADAQ